MHDQKSNILVSVIVPVYNTPKPYLAECVESLANQSYAHLEILLIDDGSRKEFADFCDELIARYPQRNFRVIHRENHGVSATRNFGIEQAKGDYLLFVDSDDVVGKYYAETLLSTILQYHSDVAKCGYVRFHDGENIGYKDDKPSGQTFYQEGDEIWKGYYSSYLWDKIFDRSVFRDQKIPEDITMCEDVLMISRILDQKPVCPAVAESLYFYRINPWSLTETPDVHKCLQAVNVYEEVRKLPSIQNCGYMLKNRIVHCCRWRLRYMMAVLQEKPEGWRKAFSEMRRKYLDDMLPIRQEADTRFMKVSLAVIKVSETAAIAYLSSILAIKKVKSQLKRLKSKA